MPDSAVVVTTEWRGVFFGYCDEIPDDLWQRRVITLRRVRMAIYWPEEEHGVLGLASDGPKKGSRITPDVPEMILVGVTGIMRATDKAQKNWEEAPWSR